jgi:hypothetical protein
MDFFKLSFQQAIDAATAMEIVEQVKAKGFALVNPADLDKSVRLGMLGHDERDALAEIDDKTGNVSLSSDAAQIFCFRRPHGNQFDRIVLKLAQEHELASGHGIHKTVSDSRGRDVKIIQAIVAARPS